MGAGKTDSADSGGLAPSVRVQLDLAAPADPAEPAALGRSGLARPGASAAATVHALTLALLGALIVAGLVTGIPAFFYAAIGTSPTGDALASWMRRRERSRLGAA